MDTAKLAAYVGKQHTDEILLLLGEENNIVKTANLKNPRVTLLLSIFLGMFGIDRLYQSGIKMFLCKLGMLLFSLGTWWIADIGYSIKTTQEANYNKIMALQSFC